jgi:O-antigen ligase
MSTLHKINFFFICLIPISLISGPFVPDLLVSYLGAFFLLFCIYNNKYSEYKNFICFFFLLLYIYLNINSIFSFNPKISFQSSATYLRVVLFIFCLSFYLKKNYDVLKFFYFITYFSFTFLLVDSIFQYSSGYNIFNYKIDPSLRVSSFFGKELIMGSYVSRLLPILIAISYLINLNFKNYFNIILLVFSGVLIILSGERISFFYFIVTLIFYFIIEFNKKNFFFLFISIALMLLILFMNKNSYQRIVIHTYNQIQQSDRIIGFSQRHVMHYLTAYEMFLERKILGNGLKSFRYLCEDDKYLQRIIKKNKKYEIVAKEDGYIQLRKEINNNQSRIISIIYKDNTEEIYHNNYNRYWYQKEKDLYYEKKIDWDNPDSYFVYKNENYYFGPQYNFKKGDSLFVNYDFGARCNTHPHNIYMQFLSETGILGFSFFFFMFCYVVFHLLKILHKFKNNLFLKKNQKSKFFLLLSVFLAMFPLLPSGSYFNNWMLIISYLPIGIYLSLLKKS